jgi:cation:H+ antiporter
MGLSPLIIGLTIVGFGTSSPEMLVSVRAAITGSPGIALGNVIGSNICNIALILGVASFIRPLTVNRQLLKFDVPIMIGCSLVLMAFLYDAELTRLEGGFLFLGILAYVGYSLYDARRQNGFANQAPENLDPVKTNVLFSIVLVIIGLGLLIFGARLFVDGAIALAEALGVSKAVIGLTVVALGTSLPELATSVVASIKNEGDISLGCFASDGLGVLG